METVFPRFISERPWNYKNDLCVTGAAFLADVAGNPRWNRFGGIDRATYFKDRVVFFSTYHAKRDSEVVRTFDSAYIRAFGALPTLYSYRGYDTAVIFAPAMYGDIEYDLEDRRYTPLQTTYLFGQGEGRENHVNRNWMRDQLQTATSR